MTTAGRLPELLVALAVLVLPAEQRERRSAEHRSWWGDDQLFGGPRR